MGDRYLRGKKAKSKPKIWGFSPTFSGIAFTVLLGFVFVCGVFYQSSKFGALGVPAGAQMLSIEYLRYESIGPLVGPLVAWLIFAGFCDQIIPRFMPRSRWNAIWKFELLRSISVGATIWFFATFREHLRPSSGPEILNFDIENWAAVGLYVNTMALLGFRTYFWNSMNERASKFTVLHYSFAVSWVILSFSFISWFLGEPQSIRTLVPLGVLVIATIAVALLWPHPDDAPKLGPPRDRKRDKVDLGIQWAMILFGALIACAFTGTNHANDMMAGCMTHDQVTFGEESEFTETYLLAHYDSGHYFIRELPAHENHVQVVEANDRNVATIERIAGACNR